MPNIFHGFEKLDDNTIIESIAILEAATMGSVFKGYGTTLANKSAKLVNGIGNLFGKNPEFAEIKEKRIEDYIDEKKKEIKYLKRQDLNLRLKNTLKSKVDIVENTSEDSISAKVIDSVAKHLKIPDNMTAAQKADSIHRRYLEKLLDNIQKSLSKQDSKEANKTVNEIEKNIEKLSDIEKEELKNVLNIEHLSGNEVRNVMMKAGAPALIIGGLSATGFGAFMALTTIIHAIFTTILGVTLPFAVYTTATGALSLILGPVGIAFVAGTAMWQYSKGNKNIKNEIMGQLIFSSVTANGGSFTVKNEVLPSYESNAQVIDEIRQRDLEYEKLVKENNLLNERVNNLQNKYKASKDEIMKFKIRISSEENKRKKSEEQIEKLRLEKGKINAELSSSVNEIRKLQSKISISRDEALNSKLEYLIKRNNENEAKLKKLVADIKYQENVISEASIEIDKKSKLIFQYENTNIELNKQNEKFKLEMQSKDAKMEKTEAYRKKEIKRRWEFHFNLFEITNRAIKDASKFSNDEILEIEKVLFELHSLKDFRAISRGKIKDNGQYYEHLGFSLPCGFPSRILYKINDDNGKKVTIERIYKHNVKEFQ